MSITGLREGIAANLSSIPGLRVFPFVPDNPPLPAASVTVERIDFDQAFRRGLDFYTFDVIVIAQRASERSAQSTLDSYCDPTGDTSVKAALESDKTLGGKAFDLRVTDMSSYGPLSIGDVIYLAATFTVTVYANT